MVFNLLQQSFHLLACNRVASVFDGVMAKMAQVGSPCGSPALRTLDPSDSERGLVPAQNKSRLLSTTE